LGWSELDQACPVIIDNGTALIKAGMAWQPEPQWVQPSCIACPTANSTLGLSKKMLIGGEVMPFVFNDFDQLHRINDEVFSDTPSNWADLELLWQYILDELNIHLGSHPVLMTLPMHAHPKVQQHVTEVVLETVGSPAVYIEQASLLPYYASQRHRTPSRSALVIDIGHSSTQIVALADQTVIMGKKCPHLGGRALEKLLGVHLSKSSPQLMPVSLTPSFAGFESTHSYLSKWLAADVAKRLTQVAPDKDTYFAVRVDANIERTAALRKEYHVAWDVEAKEPVTLCYELLDSGEYLFQPQTILNDFDESVISLPQAVAEVVRACPANLRKELVENTVVSGGVSKMRGLVPRLTAELAHVLPGDLPKHVHVLADDSPVTATWRGGRELCSMVDFQKRWYFKWQLEEEGYHRVFLKSKVTKDPTQSRRASLVISS